MVAVWGGRKYGGGGVDTLRPTNQSFRKTLVAGGSKYHGLPRVRLPAVEVVGSHCCFSALVVFICSSHADGPRHQNKKIKLPAWRVGQFQRDLIYLLQTHGYFRRGELDVHNCARKVTQLTKRLPPPCPACRLLIGQRDSRTGQKHLPLSVVNPF